MDAEHTKILQSDLIEKFKVGDYVSPKGKYGNMWLFRITEIKIYSIGIQNDPDNDELTEPGLIYGMEFEVVYSHDGSRIWNWLTPNQVDKVFINKEIGDILYK